MADPNTWTYEEAEDFLPLWVARELYVIEDPRGGIPIALCWNKDRDLKAKSRDWLIEYRAGQAIRDIHRMTRQAMTTLNQRLDNISPDLL